MRNINAALLYSFVLKLELIISSSGQLYENNYEEERKIICKHTFTNDLCSLPC